MEDSAKAPQGAARDWSMGPQSVAPIAAAARHPQFDELCARLNSVSFARDGYAVRCTVHRQLHRLLLKEIAHVFPRLLDGSPAGTYTHANRMSLSSVASGPRKSTFMFCAALAVLCYDAIA